MTMKSLIAFSEYKLYISTRLSENGSRSGLRGAFAKALGCQGSFISQVLHSDLHLSLEQACRANDFFKHSTEDSHIFMLLVQKDRAGTHELRRYFQSQLNVLREERDKIKNRVITTTKLNDEHRATYYEKWDVISIHMALAVPGLRNAPAIASALGVNVARVEVVLKFLLETGLAKFVAGEYRIGDAHLHLGSDSPFVQQHHTNWRIEMLKRLNGQDSGNLHYSAVYSLSRDDYERLRENLIQTIQNSLAIVRPSPEEIVVCQTLDLVPLSGV